MIVKKCALLDVLPAAYRAEQKIKFRCGYAVRTEELEQQPKIKVAELPESNVKLVKQSGSVSIPESKRFKSVKTGGEISVLDKNWRLNSMGLYMIPVAMFKTMAQDYTERVHGVYNNSVEWLIDFNAVDYVAADNMKLYYLNNYSNDFIDKYKVYYDKYIFASNDIGSCTKVIEEDELARYEDCERPEFDVTMMTDTINIIINAKTDEDRVIGVNILLQSDWDKNFSYLMYAWCISYAASANSIASIKRNNRFKQLDARFLLSKRYGILGFYKALHDYNKDIKKDMFDIVRKKTYEEASDTLARNNFFDTPILRNMMFNYILK